MLNNYLAKECSLNNLAYQINEPLAPQSTFGIGGQCDYFVKPFSEGALISLIAFLNENRIRYTVIGNASNLLFDDAGYRGCVISTQGLRSVSIRDTEIEVGAGYSLIALSSQAQKRGLSGLEFACSIPATVGGAVYMNAGAYGGEIKDIVTTVRYLSPDGKVVETSEHGFSYRHSVYQENDGVILSCCMSLTHKDADLILDKMEENRQKREATQPTREKSAGSVFRRMPDCIPAKLIDEAGLKGFSCGGAEVSTKHAGFIVNRGSATSRDVCTLISRIQEIIKARYGVSLCCEIRFISAD